MENFRDDPPFVIGADQGEKIREEFRPDRPFDLGEGGNRPGEFDRDGVLVCISIFFLPPLWERGY
jgi:hypothetical protein